MTLFLFIAAGLLMVVGVFTLGLTWVSSRFLRQARIAIELSEELALGYEFDRAAYELDRANVFIDRALATWWPARSGREAVGRLREAKTVMRFEK